MLLLYVKEMANKWETQVAVLKDRNCVHNPFHDMDAILVQRKSSILQGMTCSHLHRGDNCTPPSLLSSMTTAHTHCFCMSSIWPSRFSPSKHTHTHIEQAHARTTTRCRYREERLELKLFWTAKSEEGSPPAPPSSVVGTVWISADAATLKCAGFDLDKD